jgi:diacylglycerol kinase (ATP)
MIQALTGNMIQAQTERKRIERARRTIPAPKIEYSKFKRRLSDGVVHEPQSRHTDPGPRVPLPGDGHTLGDGQMTSNETAQVPDWTENAVKGGHLFVPCGERSTESCYFPSFQCKQKSSSPRIKCVSCRIVVHAACKEILNQNQTLCRPLYREPLHHEVGNKQTGVSGASEQCRHHWILRKRCEGRCMACKKKFEKDRFNFSSSSDTKQAYRAISCSWCKENYHYSDQCFNVENKLKEACSMGEHSKLIVPPYWIVKTRRSTRPYRKRSKNCDKKQLTSLKKSFVIRPKNDYEEKTPLLVFINPRSGGNQGRKVLAEFQYLLNPRQVFDLTQGGPIPALELYKRVPNLRILCCGGDGTCG